MWNDFPLHVTSAQSLAVFRQRLKTFVFSLLPGHSDMTYFFSGIPCGACNYWHYLGHVRRAAADDDDCRRRLTTTTTTTMVEMEWVKKAKNRFSTNKSLYDGREALSNDIFQRLITRKLSTVNYDRPVRCCIADLDNCWWRLPLTSGQCKTDIMALRRTGLHTWKIQ